jgi:hypothetical protein
MLMDVQKLHHSKWLRRLAEAALLLSNLSVTEAAMRTLAEQRGVAVCDYLASLKLPKERLFLGATKAASDDAQWQPRAELNLAPQ